MESVNALKIENLTKEYGNGENRVIAVNQVSFSVQKGEFVVIIGPSGCGKSTLLHMIGGVEHPTSGCVCVNNVEMSPLSVDRMAVFRRRNIGIVYQNYNLIPVLTVKENILLPLELDRKKVDKSDFDCLVHQLGLDGKLNALPSQLSGGQQQRVAIARALICKPTILLADEPTGSLDTMRSEEVVSHIKRLNVELGQTVIMVTHDPNIAAQGNRIIQMRDGTIVRDEVNRL